MERKHHTSKRSSWEVVSYAEPAESACSFERPALVVGHPGHELRVFGWMSQYHPRVYVITDGSGRQGVSRLPSTQRVLGQVAAESDDGVFGVISDASIYRAILAGEIDWFLEILERLTESFIANRIGSVAAEAMEGFNPTHDLCRALVNAAVLAAQDATGRTIANYEFCLTEWEQARREEHGTRCLHLCLDDDLLRQKLEAAQGYTELRDEVREAIRLRGEEYFRSECLKQVTDPYAEYKKAAHPDYEGWGARRVAEGTYESVIRYEKHVLPIIEAIYDGAAGASLTSGTRSATHSGRMRLLPLNLR